MALLEKFSMLQRNFKMFVELFYHPSANYVCILPICNCLFIRAFSWYCFCCMSPVCFSLCWCKLITVGGLCFVNFHFLFLRDKFMFLLIFVKHCSHLSQLRGIGFLFRPAMLLVILPISYFLFLYGIFLMSIWYFYL